MVRKRSFYDFYDLEEDVGLAPDIPATFVSVIAIAAFTVLSLAHIILHAACTICDDFL